MKHKEFTEVMKYLKGYRARYFISMFLNQALVSVCYNLVLAYIMKQVVNGVVLGNLQFIKSAFVIALFSFLLAFTFQPVLKKWNQGTVKRVMNQLRSRVFCHMEQLEVREVEEHSIGDMMTRMTQDVDTLEDIYRVYLPNFVFALFHGLMAMVCMFAENAVMAVLGIALGFGSVWMNHKISKRLGTQAKRYQEAVGQFSEQVIEGEDGMIDLRMNDAAETYFGKMSRKINEMKITARRREHYQVTAGAVGELTGNLQEIGLMVIGFWFALTGRMTIGSVIAVVQLNNNANYLFENFSSFLSGVRKNLSSGVRVREFMELRTEAQGIIPEKEKAMPTEGGQSTEEGENEWRMSDVSYEYVKDHPVFEHKNFNIHTGEFVGIMGKSGCGKSTFFKILSGFYAPVKGNLSLNGKRIDQMAMSDWRKQIAYVSQDCYLYQMSVYDNIRLGNWKAGRGEVEEACHLAMADEFIEKMEHGYDTMILENGANLSGGQRQRLALARAFLRDASLFLVDEGTAALDADTEKGIAETIEKLRGKKAVLMVSHRREAIMHADRIVDFN